MTLGGTMIVRWPSGLSVQFAAANAVTSSPRLTLGAVILPKWHCGPLAVIRMFTMLRS